MGINEDFIIKVLRDQLGTYERHNNGEHSFHCPFCNHYKKKLQINVNTYKWHCWVCHKKGQTISSLLTKVRAPKHVINKVREIANEAAPTKTEKIYSDVSLPAEFQRLCVKKTDPNYRNALHYTLNDRKLTALDILKYNIGYCDSGEYAGMVIIPSYDSDYRLNFFTGRSYYAASSRKHKNPSISKDVIGFEHLINWNCPITLVEGVYDAITVRDNAIPLFGKIIGDNLKKSLLLNKAKQINICLDRDALVTAIEAAEYFVNNGVQVKLVELVGKDPNDMGYEEVWKAINNTPILNFTDLLLCKLKV